MREVGIVMILVATFSTCILISYTSAATKSTSTWKTETNGEFTFKYPSSWDLKEKENRFTTIDNTLEYDRGVRTGEIIFEHDQTLSDKISDFDTNATLDVIKNVLTDSHTDANIFETGVDKYVINNLSAPYAIATYTEENLFGFKNNWVDLMILIPLGNDDYVLTQYVAGENDFDKLLPDVERIFQSVRPVIAGPTPSL
jgi:hypothetical protein